jgi:hypothetical protein
MRKPVHHWLPLNVSNATIRAGLFVVSDTLVRLSVPMMLSADASSSGPIVPVGAGAAGTEPGEAPNAPSVPWRPAGAMASVRPSLVTVVDSGGGAGGGGAVCPAASPAGAVEPRPTPRTIASAKIVRLLTRMAAGWTFATWPSSANVARCDDVPRADDRGHASSRPDLRAQRQVGQPTVSRTIGYTTAAIASASCRSERTS